MQVGGRDWDARDLVIMVGVLGGLIFALVALTGSSLDQEGPKLGGTALALILFTVAGSAGVALADWQPRFALFGASTAILALLAFGATFALIWSNRFYLFGFGFDGTGGTVGSVTVLFAIVGAAACVLLGTTRPGEDGGTRLVRFAGIGALAFFVAVVVLAILADSLEVGGRVYAIDGTVYVVATAILLVLRLLPTREEGLT